MRNFFHSHWKVVVVLILLILVAILRFRVGAAEAAPDLAERMRRHVQAIAFDEHDTGTPQQRERAAIYIDTALARAGYTPARHDYTAGGQQVRRIEVAVSQVAAGARPDRLFIVGATAGDHGAAAVLELARLLKNMQPGAGTQVRFVFVVPIGAAAGRYSGTGNFLAFLGTLEASGPVRDALAAFRAASGFPAHGLATPAHTTGVTLSGPASCSRQGYPALIVTDTAFLRYPYHQTADDMADDMTDRFDYDSMARVVTGLSKTIIKLAGAQRG